MRRIISATLLVLLLSQLTSGHTTAPIQPTAQSEFTLLTPAPTVDTTQIIDTFRQDTERKPHISVQLPEPKVIVKETPKPKAPEPRKRPVAHRLAGVASWYCLPGTSACTRGHSGGLYAAIRRDLLFLRGRTITVSSGGNSIYVKVIDCNCGPNANIIDLYSDAFRKLAPLSRGRIKVTVAW